MITSNVKMARILAAKTALAIRVDALGEGETSTALGVENRAKVEQRIKMLETGTSFKLSGRGKANNGFQKYDYKKGADGQNRDTQKYNQTNDSTMDIEVPTNGK